MQLTIQAARHIMLAAQGLLTPPEKPAVKEDLLAAIRQMNVLQIDTIHVVARSPYLVLWSRVGDYPLLWLDDLLAEGALFEYWSHAACFLPIEDYPIYRRLMLEQRRGWWAHIPEWLTEHAETVERVLALIRAQGPVRSADFERTDGQKGGWWNWKEEKEALEVLFANGDLMIPRREKFQRFYDLRQNVLPDWQDDQAPPYPVVEETLALRAVRALGVATPQWVPDYFRMPKTGFAALLKRLAEDGQLIRATVEGWQEPVYIHPDRVELAQQAARGELIPTLTTLLSPFDPLVWDRQRALALFDFDYHIECYTPAPKRQYGYFSLPILDRGKLVGRLDAKAHRQKGIFEVKALHLEPGTPLTADLAAALRGALLRCANWHGTPEVVIRQTHPPEMSNLLG